MKNRAINFNSMDWDSITDTINKVNDIGCVQFGETDDGENITFDVTEDGKLHTTVFQHNGWERHNYYDPSNHTVEEVFRRPE